MRLEDGLYAYLWRNPYENNCNTYVIQSDKTVLIDPGHSRYLDQLFEHMEKDGISAEAIDLLIVTHAHPDHFEGLKHFLSQDVKIAMAREEERYLRESGKALFEMMTKPLPPFRIDFFLKEGELCLGREVFNIYETPGHSPGSLSIYWPGKRALFTGDTIFYGGIGRTDLAEGNPAQLRKTIERMAPLETEILLPGHGELVLGRDLVLQNFEFIRQNFYPYL